MNLQYEDTEQGSQQGLESSYRELFFSLEQLNYKALPRPWLFNIPTHELSYRTEDVHVPCICKRPQVTKD